MDASGLVLLCDRWRGSTEEFAHIVAASIQTLGLYQHELAREFQVADSTVSRWANGVARPLPRLQELILAAIRKRASRIAKAQAVEIQPQPEHPAVAVRMSALKHR
jgi:transcriptional regulator with XRE-family HTH domain